MSKRAEWHAKMRPLRDQGMTHKAIAEKLGCGESTVRNALNDPTGEKDRARGRRYTQKRKTQGREPLVPVKRFAPILQEWIAKDGIASVSRECGIGERQIYAYINGEREHVFLRVVEDACARMGRPDIVHVELGDIIEAL